MIAKRPWVVTQNDYAVPGIAGADGEYVIEEVANNADKNAEFIVKAVNAHDALVAALKLVAYRYESGDIGDLIYDMPEIEAALEQVK